MKINIKDRLILNYSIEEYINMHFNDDFEECIIEAADCDGYGNIDKALAACRDRVKNIILDNIDKVLELAESAEDCVHDSIFYGDKYACDTGFWHDVNKLLSNNGASVEELSELYNLVRTQSD